MKQRDDERGLVEPWLLLWIVLILIGVVCMIAAAFAWADTPAGMRKVVYLGFGAFMLSFLFFPGGPAYTTWRRSPPPS